MKNFYTETILKAKWPANKVCTDLNMLEPGTRAKVQAFIADAKANGHDVRVGETYRSQARQGMLYRKGFTKLQHVGTHGYGLAADLQLFVNGRYDPNGSHYMFFQALCTKHNLISGIGWGTPHARHSFTDYDHIQNCPIFRQNALFTGQWYPKVTYDPVDDMIKHGIRGL